MKTRKKSSHSLRCPHEVIVAAFKGDTLPDQIPPASIVLKDCSYCKNQFDLATGGKCPECDFSVFYCSRKCQVREQFRFGGQHITGTGSSVSNSSDHQEYNTIRIYILIIKIVF